MTNEVQDSILRELRRMTSYGGENKEQLQVLLMQRGLAEGLPLDELIKAKNPPEKNEHPAPPTSASRDGVIVNNSYRSSLPYSSPAIAPENDTEAAIGNYTVSRGEYPLPKDFDVKGFMSAFSQQTVYPYQDRLGSNNTQLYENVVRYNPILTITENEQGNTLHINRPSALAAAAQKAPDAVSGLLNAANSVAAPSQQQGIRPRPSPERMENLSKDVAATIAQLRDGLDKNKQTTAPPQPKPSAHGKGI